MQAFFITIHTLVGILLVAVVLMQASQGGGLSGTFGSSATSAIFGGRGAATFLSRLTTWLAMIFMVLAILISFISAPTRGEVDSLLQQEAANQVITPGFDLSMPAVQDNDNLIE